MHFSSILEDTDYAKFTELLIDRIQEGCPELTKEQIREHLPAALGLFISEIADQIE